MPIIHKKTPTINEPSTKGGRTSKISSPKTGGGIRQQRLSQSLRVHNVSQQTSPLANTNPPIKSPNSSPLMSHLRPPDPRMYVHAGVSGIRHLFPIHFTTTDETGQSTFTRPISSMRSRTPTTDLCTNIEMIRNVCKVHTLKHLDLTGNELDELPIDVSQLIELETFNCSHNKLHDLPDILEQLQQLKEIDLSYNQLKIIPSVVYKFKKLSRLHCEHNQLELINEQIHTLKRLKILVLDSNMILNLDKIDISQLKKLEYFSMANNQIQKFPQGLQTLHHIRNINLSYNLLTNIPVDLLLINTLDVLNLSHNQIKKLPPMSIAPNRLTQIFSLDLSYNQLVKFYDYLLMITLKLDLSNNKIRLIPNHLIKKLTYDILDTKELKIDNNPLITPPLDIISNLRNDTNCLKIIRKYYDEQPLDVNVRQGFKICISGPKSSGKTALANTLEEYMPHLDQSEQQERIIHIHEFLYRMNGTHDQQQHEQTEQGRVVSSAKSSVSKTNNLPPSSTPTKLPSIVVEQQLTKLPMQRFEMDTRKMTTISEVIRPQTPPIGQYVKNKPLAPPTTTEITDTNTAPTIEPMKMLPLTIFDMHGLSEYFHLYSSFLDNSALHLLCIHTQQFQKDVPSVENIFNGTVTIPDSIHNLFQLLKLLCEKATKTRGIFIIPVATHIDYYDRRSKNERAQVLEKMNTFFKTYLQKRLDLIREQMQNIDSLKTISSSLSDRLKTFASLLNININIHSPCVPISTLTLSGVDELMKLIQRSVVNNKVFFPNVDRILPTLWAETNQFISNLSDKLIVPYMLWDNFSDVVISKRGLPHLINDITMSMHDEGKIMVFNEMGTSDRVVFLKPVWLADLLYSLFRYDLKIVLDYEKNDIFSLSGLTEPKFMSFKRDLLEFGLLHSDLLRTFWYSLLHKKDSFFTLWLTLQRFLLIGYPKMPKSQLKRLVRVETPESQLTRNPGFIREKNLSRQIEAKYRGEKASSITSASDTDDLKFDYAVIPHYLPIINNNEKQEEMRKFMKLSNVIAIKYYFPSDMPLGSFHKLCVSALFRLNIVYKKHWKNFLIGEHEEKEVKFIMESDNLTYVICQCATNLREQALEELWNVQMPILNHFEEMIINLAPTSRFDRFVRCPKCNDFTFMGEWTTPKELQCLKSKTCPKCNENVDTGLLVQPNESKRKSEELLKRIRERHQSSLKDKKSDLNSATVTTPAHISNAPPTILVNQG